jgi:UDP-galactopyranose mutase
MSAVGHYDFLLVGSGLFASVIADQAARNGKTCLVLERRSHIGGNIYTEKINGIQVHQYGAHIFHTDRKDIWEYMNLFAEFNRYTNSPVANYQGHIYNLPFNMNTFNRIWPDVITPEQARLRIQEQSSVMQGRIPRNLEEQAISLVGTDIYRLLIKGYTEKQWGRPCTELSPEIIRRLPVRFTYDNNYFNDRYQGIPVGGYTQILEKMLSQADIQLNTDFLSDRESYLKQADTIIYTGMIDEYFGYRLGNLEYRSLRFEIETLPLENYQGNGVVNYTDSGVPYTRIIEHKHFEQTECLSTVITREYPAEWKKGDEPYYPVNDSKNTALLRKYQRCAEEENQNGTVHVIFGGRLGMYQYFDMDDTIIAAFELSKKIL